MSTSHPDPAVRRKMDPTDVPESLRMRMAEKLWNDEQLIPWSRAFMNPDFRYDMEVIFERVDTLLAAVLPEYEKQVRERIVADLAAERQKVGDNEGATLQADYVIGGVCRGLSDAIEIVQGKR